MSMGPVHNSRLRLEQFFTDRLQFLSSRQASFEGSFDITPLTGRDNYIEMPGHIADHALDRIERDTAHNALLDLPFRKRDRVSVTFVTGAISEVDI
jgi:hypothetical protein